MTPSNILDLAILGVLSEGAASSETVTRIVKQLGAPGFTPTAEVIEARIADLLHHGRLAHARAGLVLTSLGQGAIVDLLRVRGPSPAQVLGAVCHTLKVCLLDLVAPEVRREVVDDLIEAHRRELDRARGALACCPCRCRFVEQCLARDVARWESEISWLESIETRVLAETDWRLR